MNPSEHIIAEGVFTMERFPGKGGWTYILLPEIKDLRTSHFGMVGICGHIDHVELAYAKLMPMGNGRLFLPVSARLRKTLNKSAGDQVHLRLKTPNTLIKVPEEFLLCLEDESERTKSAFLNLDAQIKHRWLHRIISAEHMEIKTKVILDFIGYLKK